MAIKKKKIDSVVLTARQLLKGFTTDVDRRWIWNTMPYQMLPDEEKDDDWKQWNLDWLEYVGVRQLTTENKRLQKNYFLANGVVNKADYILADENEFRDLVGIVINDQTGPFSLKFYPLIPNIINILTGEFAKRDRSYIVKATDQFSKSEAFLFKENLITQILTQDALFNKAEELRKMGIDPESEQGIEQIDLVAKLQEAESKFRTFRSIPERWGQYRLEADDQRFNMYELEATGFRDSLIADREFYHIDIQEDDYKVELWNPIYTFYHKSHDQEYISAGNYVGRCRLLSISDVINIHGSKMKPEQIENLKGAQSLAIGGSRAPVDDMLKHDSTSYWDRSKPYDKQQPNSIHYEQYMGMKHIKNMFEGKDDIEKLNWNGITAIEGNIYGNPSLLRETTAYWMSQRKVGLLFKINETGDPVNDIVDENYVITDKPIYDNSIVKGQHKFNLIKGEHIEWIWINDVWRGTKIGPNASTYYQSPGFGFEPIYLNIERCPFQFKGQNSLYGNKLPVEGKIFSERNSMSSSMINKMESGQIGFNIVNNQIMDMIADEKGPVLLMDQNIIPRNSLDGSWGKNNFVKFNQIMKDFQIALIDTSIQNTEDPRANFNHFQVADMTKTQMIASRVQLAEYFKKSVFEIVGITPQRLGSVQASESATGVQQAVNNSYAQTEIYFEQHLNYLMPKVRQMILEAAQYIAATKPEADVNYMNSKEENVWFSLEGWKILMTMYDIYVNSKSNAKAMLQKLQELAMSNNTVSDSLYEIAQPFIAKTPSEVLNKLKEFDDRRFTTQQQQQNQALQMQREQQEFMLQQQEAERNNENYWKERDIQKEILIAYIKSQSFAKDNDIDDNMIPDALEVEKFLHEQGINTQDLLLRRDQVNQEAKNHQDEIMMKDKELAMRKYEKDVDYKIAKENKTAAEMKRKSTKK